MITVNEYLKKVSTIDSELIRDTISKISGNEMVIDWSLIFSEISSFISSFSDSLNDVFTENDTISKKFEVLNPKKNNLL